MPTLPPPPASGPDPWRQPWPTVPPPTTPPPGLATPAAVPLAAGPTAPSDHRRVVRVELAAMFFITSLPGLLIGLRGFTDPQSVDTNLSALEVVVTIVAALGPAAMALYLLWRDGRLHAAGFGKRSPGAIIGYGALGAVCCFLALLVGAILLGAIYAGLGIHMPTKSSDDATTTAGALIIGILIALTAGVGEEIVFRAYAITRMEDAGWAKAALWAPWLVFTCEHLYQGPAAIVIIGGVAGVFVWLYRWQRSVWPCMIAHACYDGVLLALAAYSR